MTYDWSEAGVRGRFVHCIDSSSIPRWSERHTSPLPSFALFPHKISIYKGYSDKGAASAVDIGYRRSTHLDLRPFACEQ